MIRRRLIPVFTYQSLFERSGRRFARWKPATVFLVNLNRKDSGPAKLNAWTQAARSWRSAMKISATGLSYWARAELHWRPLARAIEPPPRQRRH